MSEPSEHTETLLGTQAPHAPAPRSVDDGFPRALGGRYLLEERIASGGMASVWRAHDEVLARTVAIKILHDHLAADDGFRERFRREAISAAKLTHPNVVGLYDTGSDGRHVYLVMEFVDGVTLKQIIGTQGRLEVGRAATIGEKVARALAYAHDRGLVHRDVKPANILIGADGAVKVADFGIAKAEEGDDLTKTGMVLGTAAYVAPEQILAEPIDGKADQYALACVLYEALTGRQPFKADSAVATAAQRLDSDPLSLRARRADVPRPVDEMVMRALSRRPEDRYASLIRFADALAPFADADDAQTAALAVASARPRGGPRHFDLDGDDTGDLAAYDHDGTGSGSLGSGSFGSGSLGSGSFGSGPLGSGPLGSGSLGSGSGASGSFGAAGTGAGSMAAESASGPLTSGAMDSRPLVARSGPLGAGTDATGDAGPAVGPGHRRGGDSFLGSEGRWLAAVLVILALVAAVVAVGFATGVLDVERIPIISAQDDGGDDEAPAPDPEPVPITIADIQAFDPLGDGGENDELLPLAVDGDPASAWQTEGYDTPALGNLKEGVGFFVDLGATRPVAAVELTSPTPGFAYELRVASQGPPEDPGAWQTVATVPSATGEDRRPLNDVTARYVLVWITGDLPPDGGRHRASVSDLTVLGPPTGAEAEAIGPDPAPVEQP